MSRPGDALDLLRRAADSYLDASIDETLGMTWWNGLSEAARAGWLQRAGTAVAAEAWEYFKRNRDAEMDDDLMLDSTFWFDEFSIPQYDHLVEQGRISREDADLYRKQRAEMGLPMDIDKLQARPDPAYEWIYRSGGPRVNGGFDVELHGLIWQPAGYSEHGKLSSPDHGVPGGYLLRELSRPYDGAGVRWNVTYKVAEGVYARVAGRTEGFDEAAAAAAAQRFEPVVIVAGMDLYPHGENGAGFVAAVNGHALEIQPYAFPDRTGFRWELSLADDSTMKRLAKLFGSHALRGDAPTAQAAAGDAAVAASRVLALCGELVGSEPFAAGKQTGRAAVHADLAAFLRERA